MNQTRIEDLFQDLQRILDDKILNASSHYVRQNRSIKAFFAGSRLKNSSSHGTDTIPHMIIKETPVRYHHVHYETTADPVI